MKNLSALVGVLVLVAACSSERSSTTATSNTEPGRTTPETPAPTVVATTVPATTAVTEECAPTGDVLPKASDDPLLMSGLVGVDIQTGIHPCFERVVIELGGTGDFPGWTVEYVDDPVRLGESDEFVEIAGDATLQVTMRVWMPSMEGDGYTGAIDIFPADAVHILELRETENHEGVSIWSIGLDAQYSFTVDVLHAPERLVIDVHVPAGS